MQYQELQIFYSERLSQFIQVQIFHESFNSHNNYWDVIIHFYTLEDTECKDVLTNFLQFEKIEDFRALLFNSIEEAEQWKQDNPEKFI